MANKCVHYRYYVVMCHVAGIHSVPWQQVDTYSSGKSWWECTHDDGYLLFSSIIQWHWNQVNTAVWPEVDCLL